MPSTYSTLHTLHLQPPTFYPCNLLPFTSLTSNLQPPLSTPSICTLHLFNPLPHQLYAFYLFILPCSTHSTSHTLHLQPSTLYLFNLSPSTSLTLHTFNLPSSSSLTSHHLSLQPSTPSASHSLPFQFPPVYLFNFLPTLSIYPY